MLATAIDAFSRGHRVWFVREAIGSYGRDAVLTHTHTCRLIEQFAEGLNVAQVIDLMSGSAELPGQRQTGRA